MSYSCFDFFCCDVCIENFIRKIISHFTILLQLSTIHSCIQYFFKMVTPVCTTDVMCDNFPTTVFPYFFPEGLGVIYSAKQGINMTRSEIVFLGFKKLCVFLPRAVRGQLIALFNSFSKDVFLAISFFRGSLYQTQHYHTVFYCPLFVFSSCMHLNS